MDPKPHKLTIQQPTLTTARLTLRPFTRLDLVTMIDRGFYGDVDPAQAAHFAFVTARSYQTRLQEGQAVHFVVERSLDAALLGEVALVLDLEGSQAELGYEIGPQHRGQGYATEAAVEVVRYGFEVLRLDRIQATTSAANLASIRVLEKVGTVYGSRHTAEGRGEVRYTFHQTTRADSPQQRQ